MNVVINLTCDSRRNQVFGDSGKLLKECVRFVVSAVEEFGGADLVLVDEKSPVTYLESLGLHCVRADADSLDLENIPPLLEEWGISAVHADGLLFVSPFSGMVTESRVRDFLKRMDGAGAAVSGDEVNGNANPFWLKMISPLSRVGDTRYVDRNLTALPQLRPGGALICRERWDEFLHGQKFFGSQWLPPVVRADGAIRFFPADWQAHQGDRPQVVRAAHDSKAPLPVLYRLPVFDMAPHVPASLAGPCGGCA